MGKMIMGEGYAIYQVGETPAADIAIITHGSFKTKNAKYTNVPLGMSLYFYTFLGDYGTEGQMKSMLTNSDVKYGVTDSNSVVQMVPTRTGLRDREGNDIFLNKETVLPGGFGTEKVKPAGSFKVTNGRVTSIAGPGSKVWDLGLTHNDADAGAVKTVESASKNDSLWLSRDIFMIPEGCGKLYLSDVFKILKNTTYVRVHNAACRVQSATGFGTNGWDDIKKFAG